jgi:hypothetical protein
MLTNITRIITTESTERRTYVSLEQFPDLAFTTQHKCLRVNTVVSIKDFVRQVTRQSERTCSFSILEMGHRMRISGNFKFNIDLTQLLQIISAVLSIIAAIITIIVLW